MKPLVIVGCAAVTVAAVASTFRSSRSPEEPDAALEATIVSAVGTAGKCGSFDLSTIAPFDWDRAYAFRAYSAPGLVEKRLGFPWPGCERSASVFQDRFQLIAFVKGQTVVRWVDHDVVSGRFEVGDTSINRGEDDVLDVSTASSGHIVVTRHGVAPPLTGLAHCNHGKVVELD